ncbi:hypothetical protein AB0H82_19315 [Streptomyces sp. NPDC050732]|uniref:hypothetical protein n=1 Tax=Streptomyces sp. NPDC050732 TaxID=3154632 RepID=UPI00342F269D
MTMPAEHAGKTADQPPIRTPAIDHADPILRVLPWRTDDGKPCLLSTDTPSGFMSRLADNVEAAQTDAAKTVLTEAERALTNPLSTRAEVEYAGHRLSESLKDVLTIAESRLERLLAGTPVDTEGTEK